MTDAERQMRRGLSALLLEAPVEVCRDLSARVHAREDELRSALALLYADCADYIRVNNLYGGDGKSAIWNQSMKQAAAALGIDAPERCPPDCECNDYHPLDKDPKPY